MRERLRIAVNAQIKPGSGVGGIETVLRVLTALGQLDDGEEEYVFIGPWDEPDWLQPLLRGPRQRIVRGPKPASTIKRNFAIPESFKRALRPLRTVARDLKSSWRAAATTVDVPVSDGFYESLDCDLIHFPFQAFVRCALPVIYNPHDLQHRHYPQFFSTDEIGRRETIYSAACHDAHTVVVASRFVKSDVVRCYGVAPEKIQVIQWSPPPVEARAHVSADASVMSRVREKYALTEAPFALYPAMTWEHKNHIRLLEAIALLRDRDELKVRLVCTGHQNDFWPRIEEKLVALGLQEQVRFLGIVSHEELSALYRLAQFVLIPTLFEAASAPLFEAWLHETPVACSSVTSLPEQASNAALLFDPLSIEAISASVARMTTDAGLREDLRRRGSLRLADFSWERMVKAYRAVYRRAAGRALSAEDQWLLSYD